MAVPVYTVRLLGGHATPSPPLTNTVATGVVWVIRDIVVQTFSDTPVTTYIVVNTATHGSVYIWARTLQDVTVEHLELRQVVNSGESLQAFTDTGDSGVLITGYRFTTATA